jgi:hypothetical protein
VLKALPQDGAALVSRGEQSESRSMLPIAVCILAASDVGSPPPKSRQPEGTNSGRQCPEPSASESPPGGESLILAHSAGLHDRSPPSIALWCAVGTVRRAFVPRLVPSPGCRPTPHPGATIGPSPASRDRLQVRFDACGPPGA